MWFVTVTCKEDGHVSEFAHTDYHLAMGNARIFNRDRVKYSVECEFRNVKSVAD